MNGSGTILLRVLTMRSARHSLGIWAMRLFSCLCVRLAPYLRFSHSVQQGEVPTSFMRVRAGVRACARAFARVRVRARSVRVCSRR